MNFESDIQKSAFHQILKEFVIVLFFTGLVCLLAFLFFGFHQQGSQRFQCDAEEVRKYQSLQAFFCKGHYFPGGAMQTDRFAHSGIYSMELNKENPYGFQYEIPYLKGNESITVSVWRFSNGKDSGNGIIVAATEGMWKAGEEVVEKSDGGWEKIQLNFSPPKKSTNHTLKIYCWNKSYEPIYFDDFEVEIYLDESI